MTIDAEKNLTITRTLDAPINLVWKALTKPDLLKQWAPFFGEFRAEVGQEHRFILGPDESHQFLHITRVTEVVEGKRLTYTWAYDNIEGDSRVTFDLLADGEKTHLTFTQEFVIPFPKDDPSFAYGNFVEGWTQMVGQLQKLVEAL